MGETSRQNYILTLSLPEWPPVEVMVPVAATSPGFQRADALNVIIDQPTCNELNLTKTPVPNRHHLRRIGICDWSSKSGCQPDAARYRKRSQVLSTSAHSLHEERVDLHSDEARVSRCSTEKLHHLNTILRFVTMVGQRAARPVAPEALDVQHFAEVTIWA